MNKEQKKNREKRKHTQCMEHFERKVLYTKTEFVAYNAYVLSRNSINLDGASLHIFKLTSNISTPCYLHGRKSIFTVGCIIYTYMLSLFLLEY